MSIEKNLESLRIEAEKKNIKLIFEVIDGRTAAVHANVTQIDRVLVNLLDNSIKYTNPGGTITVTLSNKIKTSLFKLPTRGRASRKKTSRIYSTLFIE